MNRRKLRGFTLVELLVAITVFSVLAAMAYGGLRSVLTSERAIDQAAQRLKTIQQAMLFMGRDLAQLSGRGIRDEYGDSQPPLRSQAQSLTALEFTRGGWSNPAGQMRSSLQRVGYAVEEKQLIRYSWPVLDRAPDTEPQRYALLDDVRSMKLRFMDEKQTWQESWPPLSSGIASTQPGLPRAVELSLELDDLGVVRRLFEIDATAIVATPTAGTEP